MSKSDLLFVGGPADSQIISVPDGMQDFQFFEPNKNNPMEATAFVYRRAAFYGPDNGRLFVMAIDSMTPLGVLHELISGYRQPIQE